MQKIHSLDYLFDLLKCSKDSIMVKRTLRVYINYLYYSEDSLEEHYPSIISQDL